MGYNPWQQYADEEEQRRQQEAQGGYVPPQGQPPQQPMQPQQPPSSLPQSGGLSSLMRPRDVEMDERWRGAENNALDQSGYMGQPKYGVGEAVRDFAPLAVGGTLDILLNKGRDIAPLAGAAMQANAAQDKLRATQAQNAGEFARGARTQREGNRLSSVRAVSEERQQQQYDLLNNPDHPQALARVAQLIAAGVPSEMVQGQPLRVLQSSNALYTPYFRHGAAGLTNGDAADRAGGVKRAQNDVSDEHFGTELDQTGQKAAVAADAGTRARLNAEHEGAPVAIGDAAAKEGATTTAAEAAKEASPRVYRENAENFSKTQKTNLDAIGLMDEIDRGSDSGYAPTTVAERFGSAIASYGIPPDRLPAWQAKKLLLEEWARGQSGAAISNPETAKFLQQLGQHPLQSEEASNAAYDQFRRLITKRISGAARGNPAARDVLRSYTSDPDAYLGDAVGPGAPQPSAAEPGMTPKKRGAPPMDFMGPGDTPDLSNGFTSPPQLGTTGQPRGQVPKVPIGPGQARGGAAGGGAAAAPRMRIIEDTKTGETESEMMTDDEVRAFMQGNPGVQVR